MLSRLCFYVLCLGHSKNFKHCVPIPYYILILYSTTCYLSWYTVLAVSTLVQNNHQSELTGSDTICATSEVQLPIKLYKQKAKCLS